MPSQTGSKNKGRFYIENVSKNFIVPYNDFKIEKETSRLIDLLTVKTGRNDSLDIGDEIAVFDNGANEKKRFGGFISNVEETQSAYKIEVQEFTVEIVDTKVKRVFRNVSPEQILDTLITENTNLTFKAPISSGFTIDKYVIEGKIQEAVKDIVDLLNWQARSTPQKEFYLEPRGRIESGVTFTHAQNCVVTKKKTKDSKFINTVELRAGRTNYHQTNTFSGTGSKTEFLLTEVPVGGVEVFVGGTRKEGGISEDLKDGDDFFIDQDGPSLIFGSAPASGTDNIKIEYNYEVPILVEATTQDAKIPASEREVSETITRKFLKTFNDAREYAQSYVDNKSTLVGNVEFFADFREDPRTGHLVRVEDSSKNISDDFVVEKKVLKSNGQMDVTVGDEQFNAIEWRNSVQRKIKELEKDKTTNKVLTKFRGLSSSLNVSLTPSFTVKKRDINDTFIVGHPVNGEVSGTTGTGGTQIVIDDFSKGRDY